MASSQVLLYDLPSKGRCACWSLNPWKTRIALNYKSVPYTTQWIEYPDVAPTLKGLVPPNECPPNIAEYTIPTARFDESTIIMDSKKIAAELEKRYPEPSLHLNDPVLPKVEETMGKIVAPMVPVLMANTPRNLLNKPSHDYFQETRKKRFGMSLDQLEQEKGGEQVWEGAKPGFAEMARLLKEKDGPFFLGQTVSYADFVWVTCLKWFQRIDQALYERAVGQDDAFKKQFDACAKWMQKDD